MERELIQFSPLINRNDLHGKIGYGRLVLCRNEELRGMASLNRGSISARWEMDVSFRVFRLCNLVAQRSHSSGKISRLRLLRRRGFHSTIGPGIRRERAANEITNARWCHANIFSPRYNFARSATGRKIAFAPILQPDGIHESYFRPSESHFRRITTMNH